MGSYLFVDVDTLLSRLRQRGVSHDLYELGTNLRNGATLAAGLSNASELTAVAFANWQMQEAIHSGAISPEQAFKASGYQICDVPDRAQLTRILIQDYLGQDTAINELIIATSDPTIFDLLNELQISPFTRVRLWGDVNSLQNSLPNVIVQPLDAILGVQGAKVALYIDFENIAISLDKQGYTVNLEHLISRFVHQARAHGQTVRMAAYAPWGQRGSLPPLVDNVGREITDEAPSRLAMSNIDPVFNLPGKNSADMRIARDVLGDMMHPDSPDVVILASGDRDFNEVINTLRSHNKQVFVWGVRGSISRQVETNPGVVLEYIEDFTSMQPHATLGRLYGTTGPAPEEYGGPALDVRPSQWASIILQYDNISGSRAIVRRQRLIEQLLLVNAVVSEDRAENLVTQAMAMGLIDLYDQNPDQLQLNSSHPLVEQTRLVRDRIVARVANTLDVRGWEYVNYGFLLKGISMDRDLERPGLNLNDQWRSEWVDCLVREGILHRELVPHRHNPDDLVPVIRLSDATVRRLENADELDDEDSFLFTRIDEADLQAMEKRILVSVEQFTSFRGFQWCPLGSLHRRLRAHDPGMVFQQSIETLQEKGAVEVSEYDNPQSEFRTKGISIITDSPLVRTVISERDRFVLALLALYDRHEAISEITIQAATGMERDDLALWISIMQDENVLNAVPGRNGQYSLFRTHHTVTSVAGTAQ
ncbi:MAG: NYN domain-containing protein [Anaerolineae bacterium]|nr:NYN domain-containing protein [Anaerolineae bacterium]